jgi:phage repressor protein C with HTH and peptisase S24 domain
MFVAQVVGRSMEPLIPDGSLCIFRHGVRGSRQGKRLLIEKFSETLELTPAEIAPAEVVF